MTMERTIKHHGPAGLIEAVLAVCLGVVTSGCEATRDASERAQRGAGVMAEQTQKKAAELAEAAGDRTVEAARAARDWAGGLMASGKLSETVEGWLRRGAEASGSSIEAVLRRGEQAIPVAVEIGKTLVSAVDMDTMIEPIYQEVGGDSPELAMRRAEADEAIRGMTRVEVIDGLQVGFKELSNLELGHHISEKAYLVVWRQDNRLIGFVYRSRRDVALQQLVGTAPGIIALVRSTLG
jgi:hypothetical protein